MAVTTSNLIMGPGTLYHGAFGATEPTGITTAPAEPAWKDVGGTMDGVTLTIVQEYTELEIDQVVDVPERRLTKREMTISTNLAETTLDNLKLALNGGTITAGTGEQTYEPKMDTSASQPDYAALVFDGFAPGGHVRRVIARKCLSTDNVEFAYSKADQTVFTVTFAAHYVSASTPPFKIIDEDPA